MNNKLDKRKISILIPYYVENSEVFAFLQRRSLKDGKLPDYFGFFGGGSEINETPEDCLKREIKEELGIHVTEYKHFCHYEFYGSIKDIFIMEVDKSFNDQVTINIDESQYGKFFDYDQMVAENKLIIEDKLVLSNFFAKIKFDDPFKYTKMNILSIE